MESTLDSGSEFSASEDNRRFIHQEDTNNDSDKALAAKPLGNRPDIYDKICDSIPISPDGTLANGSHDARLGRG